MAESRWLTSQHVQDEVQVSGEDLDALHAGDGPNGNELVAVHLRHQVQILGEVFSEDGREKGQRLLNAGTRRMIYTRGSPTWCPRTTWAAHRPVVGTCLQLILIQPLQSHF